MVSFSLYNHLSSNDSKFLTWHLVFDLDIKDLGTLEGTQSVVIPVRYSSL